VLRRAPQSLVERERCRNEVGWPGTKGVLQPPFHDRKTNHIGSVAQLQLTHRTRLVHFDGLDRDAQGAGDVLVALSGQ